MLIVRRQPLLLYWLGSAGNQLLLTDYCLMPLTVADIQAPIAAEMELFEQKFKGQMKSDVMLLDQIMNYIVKRKGKQLRPMFVFLMAGVCGQIQKPPTGVPH